jgi:hypothetical protein
MAFFMKINVVNLFCYPNNSNSSQSRQFFSQNIFSKIF